MLLQQEIQYNVQLLLMLLGHGRNSFQRIVKREKLAPNTSLVQRCLISLYCSLYENIVPLESCLTINKLNK